MIGWTAVVTALSVAVIAVFALVIGVGGLVMMRRLDALSRSVTRLVDSVDREARPALDAVRRTAEDAGRVAAVVRSEAEGLVGTSKRLRGRVDRFAGAVEERLLELETLLDVLQDELEETVLDVASVLRTTRRGSGVARALKRAVLGRRK